MSRRQSTNICSHGGTFLAFGDVTRTRGETEDVQEPLAGGGGQGGESLLVLNLPGAWH